MRTEGGVRVVCVARGGLLDVAIESGDTKK